MDPSYMPQELLHLMEAEGIGDYYGLAYRIIKQQKVALGLVDDAREWDLLEQRADLLLHGLNSEEEDLGPGG